jgi:LacI family transcriptional regulator
MKAVTDAGLRIPEDIAFVGCGNLRYAEYLKVPLTSIDHSTQQMGQIAARLVIELSDPAQAAQGPRVTLIEPRLVVRQSSVGR